MDLFVSRKLKFKAWNTETNLMMRLKSIDCNNGELFKKDHVLLQFTGLLDHQGDEIYDMDILLIGTSKHVIHWNLEENRWQIRALDTNETRFLEKEIAAKGNRLCSYFETS